MKRSRTPGGLWRVHTYITREKEKLLSKIAKNKGTSRSELLRYVIDLYLEGKFNER